MEVYSQAAELIKKAKKIMVMTGAGISVASGIPDFRSKDGLYGDKEDIPYYLSMTFFRKDPEKFWAYYKDLLSIKLQDNYQPNAGHYFLADLENKLGKDVTIVTQNVDGLHQKAGNTKVIDIHGNSQRSLCLTCGTYYGLDYINATDTPVCEKDNTVIKPGMVLFEEAIHGFDDAYDATTEADLFIALGTSLQVGPVNQLPRYAAGNKLIVNKEPTTMDYLFQYRIHEDINSTFAKIKEYL